MDGETVKKEDFDVHISYLLS